MTTPGNMQSQMLCAETSSATHLLDTGHDIRTVQELPGHKDVRTTMVYTHVLNQGPMGVESSMDKLKRGI